MDKNIAALLRTDARTVGCAFTDGGRIYTYVSDDPAIQVDDLVVVPAADIDRNGHHADFKVVRVARVDEDVQIEPNSDVRYKWIVGRVDMDRHQRSMKVNEEIESSVSARYKENMRAAFRREILSQLGDSAPLALSTSLAEKAPAKRPSKRAKRGV